MYVCMHVGVFCVCVCLCVIIYIYIYIYMCVRACVRTYKGDYYLFENVTICSRQRTTRFMVDGIGMYIMFVPGNKMSYHLKPISECC